MANTRVQLEVEEWIRGNWLPIQFGQLFRKKQLKLVSGGSFEFDAVSEDGKIALVISTSGARTSGGKQGSGKIMKIRADLYFLLLVHAKTRALIFTERDMYEQFKKEQDAGRTPGEIKSYLAKIPDKLRQKLEASRRTSIAEVTSSKHL